LPRSNRALHKRRNVTATARPWAPPGPPPQDLAPVWLFDLDDTLHNATARIMPLVNRLMSAFVAAELGVDTPTADAIRHRYWLRYGATLLGMVDQHRVAPQRFLQATHPMAELGPLVRRDPRLIAMLRRLRGRKIILTNAPHHYATEVLLRLGIHGLVDHLIPIEAMQLAGQLRPKPSRSMLRALLARHRLSASRCILVEDSLPNLAAARAVGLRTVFIHGFHRGAGRRPRQLAGPGRRVAMQLASSHQLARLRLRR